MNAKHRVALGTVLVVAVAVLGAPEPARADAEYETFEQFWDAVRGRDVEDRTGAGDARFASGDQEDDESDEDRPDWDDRYDRDNRGDDDHGEGADGNGGHDDDDDGDDGGDGDGENDDDDDDDDDD